MTKKPIQSAAALPPAADRLALATCDGCGAIHIDLLDRGDNVIATVALELDVAIRVRDHLSQIIREAEDDEDPLKTMPYQGRA